MASQLRELIVCNHFNGVRKIEVPSGTQMGTAVSMVSTPGPPLSGGTYVEKYPQHKTNSFRYGTPWTPTADKYIHFGFYFRFGLQIIPDTVAGYIRFIAAFSESTTQHWHIRLARVDDSNHEFALFDAANFEQATYANPVAVDTWYRGEVIWWWGISAALRFKISEVSGTELINDVTIFDVNGENLKNAIGSQIKLATFGQGDNPLTYPTDLYFSQGYAIDGIDGVDQAFPGHVVHTYRSDNTGTTPDFDNAGAAGSGDELDYGDFGDTSDDNNLTYAGYDPDHNGAVKLEAPNPAHAGADIVGASWMARITGVFMGNDRDLIYGKFSVGSPNATVSKEQMTGMWPYFRFVQSFNASSSHRIPDAEGFFVLGLGHRGGSGIVKMTGGWAHALMVYPIPAGLVGVDGVVKQTRFTGAQPLRVLIG